MTSTKSHVKFCVVLGVVAVSFGSIIIKTSQAPSLTIASYRMLFTVLLLTPFMFNDGSALQEVKSINRKNILLCILSGFFLAMHFITWISSLQYTSINSSTILVNTHPIFIVLFSTVILREKYSTKAILAISLTFIGGVLISWGDLSIGSLQLYGDILALLGGFFVSGYILIGNRVRKDLSAKTYCYIVYSFSVIFLFLTAVIMKVPLFNYDIYEYIRFLGLAFICTILGHSVFNWALAYIKPSFVSLSILGEPVFASLWAVLIFGEIPSYLQLIGSVIVLSGIITYFRLMDKEESLK